MYTNRYLTIMALGALVSTAGCNENGSTDSPARSNDSTQTEEPDSYDASASGASNTAFDQSESYEDIQVTAQIRQAIINDDRMSVNAQNCLITTDESGLVTLRGIVNSHAEKDEIDAMARSVDGVTRVDNQLEIDTD